MSEERVEVVQTGESWTVRFHVGGGNVQVFHCASKEQANHLAEWLKKLSEKGLQPKTGQGS